MIREFGLLLAVGIAAICLGSIILPARHPRHPRVQVADEGPRLPRGSARPARGVARQHPGAGAPCCSRSPASAIFVGGIAGRGQARAADRPGPVGQPGQSRSSRTSTRSRSETGSSSELGVFVTTQRRLHRQVRRRSRTTSPRDTLATVPEEAAHRLEHRDGDRRHRRRRARRAATSRPAATTSKDAYDVAPSDIKASTVDRRRPRVQHHLPHRPRLARGACAGRARASATTTHPPAGHPGHAVGARGRRRRPARQPRGQPRSCSPTSRSCSCSCSSPSGCAPSSASLLSLVPVLIAVGIVVAGRVRVQPQAEPDDRGRRAARGRGVHRVHVADPVALRRGATTRATTPREAVDVAASRTGRAFIVSGLTAIAGVAVLVVLVAAAAARLRPHRRA